MRATITRLTAIALLGTMAAAAQADNSFEGDAHDAWLAGKVETVFLLNRHLNNFKIDTDVTNGTVRLTGTVESDVDRDLAGALAEGVEGVTKVDNELMVDAEKAEATQRERKATNDAEGRTFGSWVDDATTTATVKSKLLANSETKGLEIDVDTRENVVTLSGRVETDQVKQLAQQLAMNTNDVRDVRNNLVVDPE